MKIAVVGLGYVGLSNAVLLAQRHQVFALDVSAARVDAVNRRSSPIEDELLQAYLRGEDLDLRATSDPSLALPGSRFIVVATPTDYDPVANTFDTDSVESVVARPNSRRVPRS
jgi:UDPglucose 6-dehydrogenase